MEVLRCDILIPMLQFPYVTVGIPADHPLMCNLHIRVYPNHAKLCILLCQLMTQTIQIIIITDLIGERCVDQHRVIVFQCIKCKVQDRIVLIVTDLSLEEIGGTVVLLVCNLEDLLGKNDQSVLVQVYAVGQCLCKLL